MANQNHETKAEDVKTNIYSREFKDRLKNLVEEGNFKREILFNGVCREYSLLTYEEQEKLSRKFKAFVSDNIISLMDEEVEFILSCSDIYGEQRTHEKPPFDWDDVENLESFNYERAYDDVLNELLNHNFDVDYNTVSFLNEMSQNDLDFINEYLDQINFNLYIDDDEKLKMNFEDLQKKVEKYLERLDNNDLKELIEDNNFIWGLEVYDYEEQEEVYQWFLVSSWLCNELKAHDEVVISSHNYWGRCTYGQSIELDCVMHDIFLKWWCN